MSSLDITLCNYKDCPKSSTCHRYNTYIANKGKLGLVSMVYFNDGDFSKCNIYWKDFKNEEAK